MRYADICLIGILAAGSCILFFVGANILLNSQSDVNDLSEFPDSFPNSYELLSFSTFPHYTQRELKENSDLIIYGKILYVSEAKWSTPDGKHPEGISMTKRINEKGDQIVDFAVDLKVNEFIYTDMFFQVETIYKGNLETDQIIIRLPSGKVDELKSTANLGHNAEDYKVGDEAIFFLKKYKDEKNCYYLPTPQGAFIRQENSFIVKKDDFRNYNNEKLSLFLLQ